ncbi:uncharacterized protein LOC119744387 [Patiria miniata]|uniref:Ig-like domain-containing protein n=1 Tax=Patiria miniata TaxID=46514 RepID=A0A914BJE1_PATMI|nr:uncharacterized protein LOC119744387 [Patiria miniata]
MYLFLLCSWSLFSGFGVVVNAEPAVTAWIITPERDRKFGGRVEMRRIPCGNNHTSSKPNTDLNSNATHIEHTTSNPRGFENSGLEHDTYHEPSQVRMSARPEQEAQASYSAANQEAAVTNNASVMYAQPHKSQAKIEKEDAAVYAQPHKPQSRTDKHNAKLAQEPEQMHSNHVLDSTNPYSLPDPLGSRPTAVLKPIAKVPPTTRVPKKPEPYKPKAQRASVPHDIIASHREPGESIRPNSTPSQSPITPDDNTFATATPPSESAMYAQVSLPQAEVTAVPNPPPPSPPDHLVYADLDLHPDSSVDVNQPVSTTQPPAVYAQVMKNRPKPEDTIAEPTVTAWIVTPERNQKIGGSVHMRCVANNLEADHIVEWRTENPINSLRWGGGTDIVASAKITLRVYSPSESFPICSPDGPTTVDTGTQLSLTCSADTGNATITVTPIPAMPNTYPWITSVVNGKSSKSLDLTLDASHDNLTFECSIPSVTYIGLRRSCFVGPISVISIPLSVTEVAEIDTSDVIPFTTTSPMTVSSILPTPLQCPNGQSSLPVTWVATSAAAIILFVMSCIINIFLICQNLKLKRHISVTEKTSSMPQADPYMELQPTDDSHRVYTEPETRGSTIAQHTYCQTLGEEKKHTEDDYERPDDETDYEVTSVRI